MKEGVLFVLLTPGEEEKNTVALVPYEALTDHEVLLLEAMNYITVNQTDVYQDVPAKILDQICEFHKRFGLEESDEPKDLEQFVNPKPPYVVHEVIVIGWAV